MELALKLLVKIVLWILSRKSKAKIDFGMSNSSDELLRIAHTIEGRDEAAAFLDRAMEWAKDKGRDEKRIAVAGCIIAIQRNLESALYLNAAPDTSEEIEKIVVEQMAEYRDPTWIPHVSSLSSLLFINDRTFFKVSASNKGRLRLLAALYDDPLTRYPTPETEEGRDRLQRILAGSLPEPFFSENLDDSDYHPETYNR